MLAYPAVIPTWSSLAPAWRGGTWSWLVSPPAELPPGYVLGGRYVVASTLQLDEDGQLYRALDQQTNQAVKLRRLPAGEYEEFGWREAEVLAHLDHPRLPRALGVFEEDGWLCVGQTFLEGPTLRQHFKANGLLPKSRLRPVLRSVLEVLDHLHTRPVPVIHRDVKPANLVMTAPDQLGLIDFDVASLGLRRKKDVALDDLTTAYTVGYAPPEQISGREAFPASDLYALAASMVYASTGIHPIHLWNARQGRIVVPRGYSPHLKGWLTWLLEPSLASRCPSARAALNAL